MLRAHLKIGHSTSVHKQNECSLLKDIGVHYVRSTSFTHPPLQTPRSGMLFCVCYAALHIFCLQSYRHRIIYLWQFYQKISLTCCACFLWRFLFWSIIYFITASGCREKFWIECLWVCVREIERDFLQLIICLKLLAAAMSWCTVITTVLLMILKVTNYCLNKSWLIVMQFSFFVSHAVFATHQLCWGSASGHKTCNNKKNL